MQKLVPTKYKITIDPKNLQPHAIKCNGEHTFEMTPEQFALEKLEKTSVKLPLMQKKHCRFPSSYQDRKSRKSLRSGVCICFLFGRTNIETSQLFFRDVIKFASFSRYQGSGFRSWLRPPVGRPRSITHAKKSL